MEFRSRKSVVSLSILGAGVLSLLWGAFSHLFEPALAGSLLLTIGLSALFLGSKQENKNNRFFLPSFEDALLDAIPIAVFYKDIEGRYLGCNKHFSDIVGVSEDQIIGKTVFDLWPAKLAKIYHQKDIELLARPELQRYEFKAQNAHGKEMDVLFSKNVFRSAQGEVAGLIGALLDVTEGKESAQKLDALIEKLRLANTELELASRVFTDAHEGITITDANGTIVDINNAFTRISGYAREDALGKKPSILKSGLQSDAFYESMWRALTETGAWSGQIWNRRKSGEIYACLLTISAVRNAEGDIQNYVALHSDITKIKEQEQELARMAHYDALTGLLSRTLLDDRLEQAIAISQRTKTLVAVAHIDLDGFKEINDTYGHDVGDELLLSISQRMKNTLREADAILRVGGDEFIAILTNLESQQDCEQILTRLLDAVTAVAPATTVTHVSASIGVAIYPDSEADASLLVQHADQALFEAKHAGKNRIHFSKPRQKHMIDSAS